MCAINEAKSGPSYRHSTSRQLHLDQLLIGSRLTERAASTKVPHVLHQAVPVKALLIGVYLAARGPVAVMLDRLYLHHTVQKDGLAILFILLCASSSEVGLLDVLFEVRPGCQDGVAVVPLARCRTCAISLFPGMIPYEDLPSMHKHLVLDFAPPSLVLFVRPLAAIL